MPFGFAELAGLDFGGLTIATAGTNSTVATAIKLCTVQPALLVKLCELRKPVKMQKVSRR